MKKYEVDKVLLLCDKVAPYLKDLDGITNENLFSNTTIPFTNQEKNTVLNQLAADGYIERNLRYEFYYAITYSGRMFLANGCYKGRHLRESFEKQDKEMHQRSVVSANNSAIETNRSFKKLNDDVIPKSYKSQTKYSRITILFIAISTVISLVGIYVNIKLSDKQTPLLLQKQVLSLDSLKQSLQKIDTSLQRMVKDSSLH